MVDSIMTWLEIAASILGLGGVVGAVVAAIIFARARGTTDALEKTAETYRSLYEAQAEENRALKAEIEKLSKEVSELRGEIRGRDQSAVHWAKIIIQAVSESGVCLNAWDCENRKMPEIRDDVHNRNRKEV